MNISDETKMLRSPGFVVRDGARGGLAARANGAPADIVKKSGAVS